MAFVDPTAGKLRVLLIGYGEMARRCHEPFLLQSDQAELVGVVRRSAGRTDDGTPVFAELNKALIATQPSLVVVSTPHHLHFDQARECLEYGCHVLLEKPMALDYSKAAALTDLAERKRRLLSVGLQRRYEGPACIFRSLMKDHVLGKILVVHGLFAHRFAAGVFTGWRADPSKAGGGIIDDSAVHILDLLLYFSGANQIIDVHSMAMEDIGTHLPHSMTAICTSDTGAAISVCASYLAPTDTVQEEISIYGTQGSLFARRLCRQWNTEPPDVFFKSRDGAQLREFDLASFPRGRALPLAALIDVLCGRADRESLFTEAGHVLLTHRLAEQIRDSARRIQT